MKDEPKKGESRFRRQQRSLARLVERLKASPARCRMEKEAQYRAIIRLSMAGPKNSDGQPQGLADCRKWLEQTTLEKLHLRAVTAILDDPGVANEFLNDEAPLSVAEALAKIRHKAESQSPEGHKEDQKKDQKDNEKEHAEHLTDLLTTLCSELLRSSELLPPQKPVKDFTLKCGIYELEFIGQPGGCGSVTPARALEPKFPIPAGKPEERVVRLELAPDIAEALGTACLFSGLTRAEVVAALVSWQDPARLLEELNAPEI